MVDKARKRQTQPEVQEYAEAIGIEKNMKKATWQYAEWSAAAEVRLLSAKGVKVKWMTNKQMEKYCGTGLPWDVRQRPVCESKEQNFIEEQAWNAKADEAFYRRPTRHDCRDISPDDAETKQRSQARRTRQGIPQENIARGKRQGRNGRKNGESSGT